MGIISLAALAILIWPRREDDEPEFASERPPVHWIWKVLAILLLFAVGGALVGAAILGARTVHNAPRFASGAALAQFDTHPVVSHSARRGFVLPAWLPWTLIAIAAVAVAVGVIVLVTRRRAFADRASERNAAQTAVQAAIGALDAVEDPRSAVIAAYVAMEGTFAAHGLTRARNEAPREYLRRLLATDSANDRDATTLTSLFEEARFSRHPISERVREAALAALSALRSQLGGGGPASG